MPGAAAAAQGVEVVIRLPIERAGCPGSERSSEPLQKRVFGTLAVTIHPHIRSVPVGRCIYCDASEKLSDEHIIPYSFGGNLVLRQASCLACAAKTAGLEQHVCDTILQSTRVHRVFPTRGKRAPVKELFVSTNGVAHKISKDIHPGAMFLPWFSPPWFPEHRPFSVSMTGGSLWGTAPNPVERLKGLPPGTGLSVKFKPDKFARVLAKIAHGFAVLSLGTEGFDPFLKKVIISEEGEVGRFVGMTPFGVNSKPPVADGHLHLLDLDFVTNDDVRYVVARIQLFCDWEKSPHYVVICGTLRGDLPAQHRLLSSNLRG